jgi:hypothetical protein
MAGVMREIFYCEQCGAETGFCINGAPYCPDHVFEGIGIQARLVASLNGQRGEDVAEAGRWAQETMMVLLGERPDDEFRI